MEENFQQRLRSALSKKGHRSLRAFYQDHSFSFTYEYLRLVFFGSKIPSPKKVSEIARALDLDEPSIAKSAAEARLTQKIRHHYGPVTAPSPKKLREHIKGYERTRKKEGETENKLLDMIRGLESSQKRQVVHYVQFLRKEWLKRHKKN